MTKARPHAPMAWHCAAEDTKSTAETIDATLLAALHHQDWDLAATAIGHPNFTSDRWTELRTHRNVTVRGAWWNTATSAQIVAHIADETTASAITGIVGHVSDPEAIDAILDRIATKPTRPLIWAAFNNTHIMNTTAPGRQPFATSSFPALLRWLATRTTGPTTATAARTAWAGEPKTTRRLISQTITNLAAAHADDLIDLVLIGLDADPHLGGITDISEHLTDPANIAELTQRLLKRTQTGLIESERAVTKALAALRTNPNATADTTAAIDDHAATDPALTRTIELRRQRQERNRDIGGVRIDDVNDLIAGLARPNVASIAAAELVTHPDTPMEILEQIAEGHVTTVSATERIAAARRIHEARGIDPDTTEGLIAIAVSTHNSPAADSLAITFLTELAEDPHPIIRRAIRMATHPEHMPERHRSTHPRPVRFINSALSHNNIDPNQLAGAVALNLLNDRGLNQRARAAMWAQLQPHLHDEGLHITDEALRTNFGGTIDDIIALIES